MTYDIEIYIMAPLIFISIMGPGTQEAKYCWTASGM